MGVKALGNPQLLKQGLSQKANKYVIHYQNQMLMKTRCVAPMMFWA